MKPLQDVKLDDHSVNTIIILKAIALADKLRRISDSKEFEGVFMMAHIHNYQYKGETFNVELEELEAAIKKLEEL